MAIQAGELDQEIVIESPATVTDDYGGSSVTWSTFASVWARAFAEKGNEAFETVRLDATQSVRFKLRYLSGVKNTFRIVWRGDNYDIKQVDESGERKGELWITATAERE